METNKIIVFPLDGYLTCLFFSILDDLRALVIINYYFALKMLCSKASRMHLLRFL